MIKKIKEFLFGKDRAGTNTGALPHGIKVDTTPIKPDLDYMEIMGVNRGYITTPCIDVNSKSNWYYLLPSD